MIWLIFTLLVLFFTQLGVKKKQSYIYLSARLVLLILLSLMTGLGSSAGTDHDTYVNLFYTFNSWDKMTDFNSVLLSYAIEPGYAFLNVVANTLHVSEPIFFVLISAIMNVSVVFLVYKFKKPVVAMLVFILTINYLQEINLARQCIAISFYCFSVYNLVLRKYVSHFILLLIAFTMHTTALLCLPLSLLGFVNINKYRKEIAIIASALWFFSLLVQFQIVNISSVGEIFGGLQGTRFESYADGSHGAGYDLGFNYMFNLLFIFIVISLQTEANLYKVLALLGVILINLNLDVVLRFALYFLIFLPITSGEYISNSTYNRTPQHYSVINTFRFVFIAYWVLVLFRIYVLGNPLLGSKFYSVV